MKETIAVLFAVLLVGCGQINHADEEYRGATPGDNCFEKYEYSVNQNRCALETQEG